MAPDLVAIRDHLRDGVAEVGERLAEAANHALQTLSALREAVLVLNQILCDDLVDDREVATAEALK
jgi:hypothetical protein